MIRGWLSDHEWRLSLAVLLVATGTSVLRPGQLSNPFGDSYQGLGPQVFIGVLAIAGTCIGLRSRACEVLHLRGRWRHRLVWFALSYGCLLATLWLATGRSADLGQLVETGGIAGGLAMLLAAVFSVGSSMLFVFYLFVACLLTSRWVPAQWWNPLLYVSPSSTHVLIAIGVSTLAALAYSTNVFGRKRL